MAPRGILKSPTVFPSERELRSYDEPRRPRSRSRSRDRRHAEDELQLIVPSTPALRRERSLTSSNSSTSRRRLQSRLRSQSRSRRHVRWSDPIEFVVSDGKDVLALRQLAHRRSSLPGILEDSRARFRETLREEERSRDKDASNSRSSSGSNHPSAQPPSSSSSSHKRPTLKATLSSPAVGRASQSSSSPKPPQTPAHTPTPISNEHRKRRISLPDGLEAAVKSSSHALWLPHHTEHPGDHASQVNGESSHSVHSNGHPSPRANNSNTPQSHANRHSQHSSHSNEYPQTPRRYEPALPHAREQPQLRGSGLPPPPVVSFTSQRPLSQLTTSTHRSTKSSPPEKRSSPLPLPAPPVASPAPAPPAQRPAEAPAPTPKSAKSNLFSLPAIDDLFSKDETSHSMMSVRRLFGLSTPKHEPRKLEEEDKDKERDKDKTHKRRKSKEQNKEQRESATHLDDTEQRRRASSFIVKPPPRASLHRARHSFDMGTFSLIDDMHMRWTAATARHFLPVLTPAEIQASHLTLSLNPALTTIYWDVRHPPNAVWSVIPGRKTTVWSGHNEPATVPLVPSLRIISPYFPWVVSARNPAGVTCGDVLSAIHSSARQLVWRGEFESLRATDKNRLASGYYANRPSKGALRSADSPFESGSWLVRADWLGQHTVMRGMSVSEMRDQASGGEVVLSMYLTENRRDEKKVVVSRY